MTHSAPHPLPAETTLEAPSPSTTTRGRAALTVVTSFLADDLGRVPFEPRGFPSAPPIYVAVDASWLVDADEVRHRLDNRGPARRILHRLLVERAARPGHRLSADALFAAGWPGETAIRTAALNRVYVAIAGLRKLGLRAALLRDDQGYHLDVSTAIVWTRPASP